jgi:hypothetical protein
VAEGHVTTDHARAACTQANEARSTTPNCHLSRPGRLAGNRLPPSWSASSTT